MAPPRGKSLSPPPLSLYDQVVGDTTMHTTTMMPPPNTLNLKMYFIVRSDLRMTPGKVAAQCAHAAIGSYKTAHAHGLGALLTTWETRHDAAKVTLRVNDEAALWKIHDALSSVTTTYCVVDVGRTQVPRDSVTVLAIGPVDAAAVHDVLSKLKLY